MHVLTTAISKRFALAKLKIDILDTTVKTGNRLFCPTWTIVLGHKSYVSGVPDARNPPVSDEEYTQRYMAMMLDSWKNNRPAWEEVLRSEETIALACYCQAGHFCHRLLLRDIMERLCKSLDIPFLYYGEFE